MRKGRGDIVGWGEPPSNQWENAWWRWRNWRNVYNFNYIRFSITCWNQCHITPKRLLSYWEMVSLPSLSFYYYQYHFISISPITTFLFCFVFFLFLPFTICLLPSSLKSNNHSTYFTLPFVLFPFFQFWFNFKVYLMKILKNRESIICFYPKLRSGINFLS